MVLIAYIDPGAGSIILQMILASTVGLVYRFRNSLKRWIDKFRPR